MPNPDGNPNIKKYGFTTDREEPLTEQINIRFTKTVMARLRTLENIPEFIRQAVVKALDELDETSE